MTRQNVHMAGTRQALVLRSDLAMMLLDLRNERGWTKKQLAKELGISASTLSKLELGGQFRLWERTWQRIVPALARLLEVEPDELQPLGNELIAEVVMSARDAEANREQDMVPSVVADPALAVDVCSAIASLERDVCIRIMALVREAVPLLGDAEGEFIKRCLFHGETAGAVSRDLKINENTGRSILHRARRKLISHVATAAKNDEDIADYLGLSRMPSGASQRERLVPMPAPESARTVVLLFPQAAQSLAAFKMIRERLAYSDWRKPVYHYPGEKS